MMDVLGSDPDTQIQFHTTGHQQLFNIVLVDFLSRTDKRAPVEKTCAFQLGEQRFVLRVP